MTFRRVEPGFQLQPDAVHALQGVDLRIGYVYHGHNTQPVIQDQIEQKHAVLGVVDSDYQRATAFSDQLVPGRDIFAHEHTDEPPLGNPYFWRNVDPLPVAGKYDAADLPRTFAKLARHNPELTEQDIDALRQAGRSLPDPASASGQQLTATWDKLAEHHIADPLTHAAGRAGLRGVQLWKADASVQELLDFKDRWFQLWLPPNTERAELRYVMGPEHKFRNNRALERLGHAALSMDTSGSERPILAYGVGAWHTGDLEKKLTRQDIPFKSELISPDWQTRDKELAKKLRKVQS